MILVEQLNTRKNFAMYLRNKNQSATMKILGKVFWIYTNIIGYNLLLIQTLLRGNLHYFAKIRENFKIMYESVYL